MDAKEKVRLIRAAFQEKKEKSADLDVIVEQIMSLPYGQVKKVLTQPVLAVLAKYGYGEEML